jgi:hypothetical protein
VRLVSPHVVKSQSPKALLLLISLFGSLLSTRMLVKTGCRKCGDEGTRTPDLCLAKAPLSQLSYIPVDKLCGPDRTRTCDLTLIRRAL